MIMKYKRLGENIQRIRKLQHMTQQELADKIGINLQSLSKIERGVNYPTFETLENITSILDITPNELLSGGFKNTSHIEQDIMKFLQDEEKLNVELAHGQYDNPLDKDEWIEYELKKLREYILDYVTSQDRKSSDLDPLKKLIQYQKFQTLIDKYDDFYSIDLFGESIEGHKHLNPYAKAVTGRTIINTHVDEHRKILSKVETIEGFEEFED